MATFKQIRNFLTLAQELHFARAAETLGISQAALSAEIRKLEQDVGCQLFDRSDRWQIRLTDAGSAYLQHISPLPELLDNAREAAKRAVRGETGELSIVVANTVYDSLDVGRLFRRMHDKYPQVKLKIQDRLSSPQSAELVRTGEFDAGLLAYFHQSSSVDGLRYKKIMDTKIAFAFPASHPLARKKHLRPEELCKCSFVMPPRAEAPLLRSNFDEFFISKCHTAPQISHEAVGLHAIRQLVRAGLGVSLIPVDNREKNIVFRSEPVSGLQRSIIIAWDGNNHSSALHNFISLVDA
ncbi:MAG: LysR family transcriptional regulator [Lentisphaeria bacterium]|nr:LysR family transcriptional regulator [Lentisphaeria bacterium]